MNRPAKHLVAALVAFALSLAAIGTAPTAQATAPATLATVEFA